ncbi:MAG: Gfo/Idh/MocA family oxidoreductase, partial [Thermoguttaceae bacterium]
MKPTSINRRDFLRTSAMAAAGISLPSLIPAHVLGGHNRPGANDTIRIGVIGCGGRAHGVVGEGRDVPGFRVAAVCDCFLPRAEAFAKELGGSTKPYADFRQMIDREKLDAVMIETTTHARAWIAVLAMQAGMDAYIEKPMCLTVAEGRQMVRAARKYNRVTQVGTQQRSMPINNFASDLVKNGALGKVLRIIAPNFVGPEKWTNQPAEPMPSGGSHWWDVWTNQAVLRPYHKLLHYGWDRWSDYDGGGRGFGVTGWGAHSYDQVNRALGADDTGPTEIWLEEPVAVRDTGRFAAKIRSPGLVAEEDTGKEYHGMAKITGPRAKVSMQFASGAVLQLHLDGDRGPGLGAIFVCERGKVEIGRNKIAS